MANEDFKTGGAHIGHLGVDQIPQPNDSFSFMRGSAGAQLGGELRAKTLGYGRRFWGGTAGGTANAITLTSVNLPTAGLRAGDELSFIASALNTGAVTVAIDGGSPIALKFCDGGSLLGYELYATLMVKCEFDGFNLRLERSYPYIQATTLAGTARNFAIKPGARAIDVAISEMGTSGTHRPTVRLGTGGAAATTGYRGSIYRSGAGIEQLADGFDLHAAGWSAAVVLNGSGTLRLVSPLNNIWAWSATLGRSDATSIIWSAGSVTLGGVLDIVSVTIDGGVDSYNAGYVGLTTWFL